MNVKDWATFDFEDRLGYTPLTHCLSAGRIDESIALVEN